MNFFPERSCVPLSCFRALSVAWRDRELWFSIERPWKMQKGLASHCALGLLDSGHSHGDRTPGKQSFRSPCRVTETNAARGGEFP